MQDCQSLKLAYDSFVGDTSAVWTLSAVATQGEAVQAAWDSLNRRPHPAYARLLGRSDPLWDSSNFSDLVYCAKKTALKRNETLMANFVTNKPTKVNTNTLDLAPRHKGRKQVQGKLLI